MALIDDILQAHEAIEEHLAIMDALDVGDNAKARLLMLDHLTSSSKAYSPPQGDAALPGVAA
jgi:DNA-binding GntR family transcriptional regulator